MLWSSAWINRFVRYNNEHKHRGLNCVKPSEKHAGEDSEILQKRAVALEVNWEQNPERWSGEFRNWKPVGDVHLNPEKEVVLLIRNQWQLSWKTPICCVGSSFYRRNEHGYQHAAESFGYSKSYVDIAYYGADLALSAYGAFAKTTTVKNAAEAYQIASKPNLKPMLWTKTRKAKQFKLFRYSAEDYLRGYQASSKVSLGVGAFSDYTTAKQLHSEISKWLH